MFLQKLAKPLTFEEDELCTLTGYLAPQSLRIAEKSPGYGSERLDPYVARILAQEAIGDTASLRKGDGILG
jgi:hypothetical protein|tara:strand:- start:239 stop:451 length:213 start_codon:yes stop_codon:yes gene_type:complete